MSEGVSAGGAGLQGPQRGFLTLWGLGPGHAAADHRRRNSTADPVRAMRLHIEGERAAGREGRWALGVFPE